MKVKCMKYLCTVGECEKVHTYYWEMECISISHWHFPQQAVFKSLNIRLIMSLYVIIILDYAVCKIGCQMTGSIDR